MSETVQMKYSELYTFCIVIQKKESLPSVAGSNIMKKGGLGTYCTRALQQNGNSNISFV